jgi:hypothetical protein
VQLTSSAITSCPCACHRVLAQRAEQRLHSLREAIFGLLFPSLGLFAWHGWLAWWPVALLLAEILVSLRDAVVEGDTRAIPGACPYRNASCMSCCLLSWA